MAVHLSVCQFSVGVTVKSLLRDSLCLSRGSCLMDSAKRQSKARVGSAEKACEEQIKREVLIGLGFPHRARFSISSKGRVRASISCFMSAIMNIVSIRTIVIMTQWGTI